MVAAIHYVWNGSRHEQIRWPKDNPGAIKEKSYYHDGSQVTEIVILAEGHVRDLEITDTYEPVSVSCMEIDGRLHSLHIAPIPK
jgi:hypothetical protein